MKTDRAAHTGEEVHDEKRLSAVAAPIWRGLLVLGGMCAGI